MNTRPTRCVGLDAEWESEPFDIRDTYAAQEQVLRSVWADQALDVYNEPGASCTAL